MKKICFITGGNSGIGKQAAIQFAQKGCFVIIGVRDVERGAIALSEIKKQTDSNSVELLHINMSSQLSIRNASRELHKKFSVIDVLIHNAADFDISRKEPEKTIDGIEKIWATNHIGIVLLTDLLLDMLSKSIQGRIITIASKGLILYPRLTINLNDPEFLNRKFRVSYAYYQSKLAQVMYTYWLAKKLLGTTITINCIRVPNVKIDISRYSHISGVMRFLYALKSLFSISAEQMAKTYVHLALSSDFNLVTGNYFDEHAVYISSSSYSLNEHAIESLMDLSLRYIIPCNDESL